MNLIDLTVDYLDQRRVFNIEPTIPLPHILCLIGNNFGIKPKEYLLEIIDKRFDLLIILDNSYLQELRSDPYFAVNKSLVGQIRRRYRASSEIQVDIDYLSTYISPESNILLYIINYILSLKNLSRGHNK
jgi:hypothetical protein